MFAALGFRWVVLGSLTFLSHLGETGGVIDENIRSRSYRKRNCVFISKELRKL